MRRTVMLVAILGVMEIGRSLAMAADPATATPADGPSVTLIGCVLCDRQCIARTWDHKRTGPEHMVAIYAFDGTPEIRAEVENIMKEFWPGDTLDGDPPRFGLTITVAQVQLQDQRREHQGIGNTYDFLIWQGHSRADLDRSTLRQLDLFVRNANERLKQMYGGGEGGRAGRGTPRLR